MLWNCLASPLGPVKRDSKATVIPLGFYVTCYLLCCCANITSLDTR